MLRRSAPKLPKKCVRCGNPWNLAPADYKVPFCEACLRLHSARPIYKPGVSG